MLGGASPGGWVRENGLGGCPEYPSKRGENGNTRQADVAWGISRGDWLACQNLLTATDI